MGGMGQTITIFYDNNISIPTIPNGYNYDPTLITINNQAALAGGPYSTATPKITTQNRIYCTPPFLRLSAISSTLPTNTEINFQIILGDTTYWYNEAIGRWDLSDGTYAQSNTSDFLFFSGTYTNLFDDFSITTNQLLGFNTFLVTTDPSVTPIIVSIKITIVWGNVPSTAMNLVGVTAYLANLVGAVPLPTAATPAQLLVSCDRAFFHGTNFIEPFTQAFNFSTVDGTLSASIIETATPGVPLNFSITYWDGKSVRTSKLFNAIVPNVASISLSNLSSVYPYDFG